MLGCRVLLRPLAGSLSWLLPRAQLGLGRLKLGRLCLCLLRPRLLCLCLCLCLGLLRLCLLCLCLLRPRLLRPRLLRPRLLRLYLLCLYLLCLLPLGLLRVRLRPLPSLPSGGTGRRHPRLPGPGILRRSSRMDHRIRLNLTARPGALGRTWPGLPVSPVCPTQKS